MDVLGFFIVSLAIIGCHCQPEDVPFSLDDGEDLSIDQVIMKASDNSVTFESQPLANGDVLSEGDILYTKEQWEERKSLEAGHSTFKGLRDTRYRWSNKIMPYELQPYTFSSNDQAVIQAAVNEWNHYTCVKLQPRRNERNYVYIQNGGGCSSYVGMLGTGRQALTLAPGCRYVPTTLHELGHAIGYHHEQCRPDRDSYISIYLNNVSPSMHFNFDKYTTSFIDDHGVSYDYGSIMQYGEYAFSYNGQKTIITRDPAYQRKIGNSKGLSYSDVKIVNQMYKCGEHCPAQTCPKGGYLDKNCQCQCPSGNDPMSSTNRVPIKPCSGTSATTPAPVCENKYDDERCKELAKKGQCENDEDWMSKNCALACKVCDDGGITPAPKTTSVPKTTPDASCRDEYPQCPQYTPDMLRDYCHNHQGFSDYCCKSCKPYM